MGAETAMYLSKQIARGSHVSSSLSSASGLCGLLSGPGICYPDPTKGFGFEFLLSSLRILSAAMNMLWPGRTVIIY